MEAVTRALYDRLSNDSELAGLLSTYGGEPAIFSVDPAPADAELPFVVSAGAFAQIPFDTKTGEGRQLWRDVRCYDEEKGSTLAIDAIAERIRTLLHRYALPVTGWGTLLADVTGPAMAADDNERVVGRIVTLRLVLQEESGS
jgi:hypothetical protein